MTKAEGESVKAKLSRYRAAKTLKNNLTPREMFSWPRLAGTVYGARYPGEPTPLLDAMKEPPFRRWALRWREAVPEVVSATSSSAT